MLTMLRLKNYACFQDWSELDLRPLTVLVGPNGSGKTSLLNILYRLCRFEENQCAAGSWNSAPFREGERSYLELYCRMPDQDKPANASCSMVIKRSDGQLQIEEYVVKHAGQNVFLDTLAGGGIGHLYPQNILHQSVEFDLAECGFCWEDHLQDEMICREAARAYDFFMIHSAAALRGVLHGFPFPFGIQDQFPLIVASPEALGAAELNSGGFQWLDEQVAVEAGQLLLNRDLRGYIMALAYRITRDLQQGRNALELAVQEHFPEPGQPGVPDQEMDFATRMPSDAPELDMVGQFAERRQLFGDMRIDQYFGAMLSRLRTLESARERLMYHPDKKSWLLLNIRWTVQRFCDLALRRAVELRRQQIIQFAADLRPHVDALYVDATHTALSGEFAAAVFSGLDEQQRQRVNNWLAMFNSTRRLCAEASSDNCRTLSALIDTASGRRVEVASLTSGEKQLLGLLSTLYRKEESPRRIFLEQPENNLHPQSQRLLADLLLERSLHNDDQIFVETHSEALLERLLECIESGAVAAEQVAVYLLHQDDDHVSHLTAIDLTGGELPAEYTAEESDSFSGTFAGKEGQAAILPECQRGPTGPQTA